MDIGGVFSRSLQIAWRYKFLWVFGFVMALTGGGGGGNASFRTGATNQNVPSAPNLEPAMLAAIVVVGLCVFLIFLILAFYFRFVARGALVSAVRDIENGSAPTLGSAWRAGQSYY